MTYSKYQLEELKEAIDIANIPTLLMLLVQMTGDVRWLEDKYKPARVYGMGDNPTGGLPEPVQREIRDAACSCVHDWLEGKPLALPEIEEKLLLKMLSFSVGERVPDEYADFTAAQLGQKKLFEPTENQANENAHVIIIGAGVSGICAAYYLSKSNIPYTIIEKSSHVGGVWYENRYPGCGVDSPNHLYSYSFFGGDWGMYFAMRDELVNYFDSASEELDIKKNIKFNTEAVRAKYNEDTKSWEVSIKDAAGETSVLTGKFVLSCVGIFNPPVIPEIDGLSSWEGEMWHTARWPEDADLTGKKVAIIGNGATCMQIGPEIQGSVESLTIFQRSPHWIAPHEQFRKVVEDPLRRLFQEVPLYRDWYRARLGWAWNDRLHGQMFKDPDWPHKDRSINKINDLARIQFTEYMKAELGDQADKYLDKVLPTYPPFGKRILMDNGWYRMLRQDNTDLITDPVTSVKGKKIITKNGDEYCADVLVFATGFGGQKMIDSYEVIGAGELSLRDVWGEDDPKAYLGTMIPDFPNYFVLYGPNLQPGHGGSMTFSLEMQVSYVMDIITKMLAQGIDSVEIKKDVFEEYNNAVDEMHERMLWTHPGMSTYYRNKAGRVVINSPWRNVDFYKMTRYAEFEKYNVSRAS